MNVKFDPYLRYKQIQDMQNLQNISMKGKTAEETDKIAGDDKGVKQNNAPPTPQTPEVIANFMQKLGLAPTNSKESDDALIRAKLNELESKATTEQEKQNVQSLREEFASLVDQVESAGQNQMAALNKAFFNLK